MGRKGNFFFLGGEGGLNFKWTIISGNKLFFIDITLAKGPGVAREKSVLKILEFFITYNTSRSPPGHLLVSKKN